MNIQTLKDLCSIARLLFLTDDLIIAGGAPRDILSGVKLKDIDIFTKLDEEDSADLDGKFVKSCNNLAAYLGVQATFRESNPEYPDVMDICDIDCGTGLIQIIGIHDNPIDDVPKYDFGLSQIFVTPSGVFSTELAWHDRLCKKITYVGGLSESDAQRLRSKARLERLRAKYIDWTFVNCEVLDAIQEGSV